jgi:general secretion pathway protein B
MSFILDAIAKSEQERQQQDVPDARVLSFPAAAAPRPRRLLPLLVVGALLLNAALLLLWMQSGQLLLDPASPATQNKTRPQEEAGGIPENTGAADTALPAGAVATDAAPGFREEVSKPVVVIAAPAASQLAAPVETVDTIAVSEPASVPPEPVETAPGGDADGWIRSDPDTLLSQTQPGQQAVASPDSAATPRKVSSLGELPRDLRSDLPTVIFSGHLYSGNPDSIVVFVDAGRPVMQGRQIVDEVFLHEITPTGVIVEFRGYLIEVGILQNWTLN